MAEAKKASLPEDDFVNINLEDDTRVLSKTDSIQVIKPRWFVFANKAVMKVKAEESYLSYAEVYPTTFRPFRSTGAIVFDVKNVSAISSERIDVLVALLKKDAPIRIGDKDFEKKPDSVPIHEADAIELFKRLDAVYNGKLKFGKRPATYHTKWIIWVD